MTIKAQPRLNNPLMGVSFVLLGWLCISIQDMLIKQLSDTYALHQIILFRSAVALIFTLAIIKLEGGIHILTTNQPWLHILRGLLLIIANLCFFSALAVLPLAEATSIFFIAPLLITLLSALLLGEKLGFRRLLAVLLGFAGVLLITRPFTLGGETSDFQLTNLLPMIGAFAYALMQVLTRRLGVRAKASAMAFYIQSIFIIVCVLFWLIVGDGSYAADVDNKSMKFLLRAWRYPEGSDLFILIICGLLSTVISYSLSQAYRVGEAAIISPFEYVALPLSLMWGWLFWSELPDLWATFGMLIILSSGLYVFWRENVKGQAVSFRRFLRRW